MRLLPRSLFGRLVLVLLGGLVLAQLASSYINFAERGELLYRAGGMRLAQQIADISKLLDSVSPEERRRIVSVFNAPPLEISLDRPALSQEGPEGDADMPLSMFTAVLRYALGDDLRVSVVRREGPPERYGRRRQPAPPGMPMMQGFNRGMGMQDFAADGRFFLVQVALRDGALVTFDSHLSPEAAAIPLRLALTLFILLGSVIQDLFCIMTVTDMGFHLESFGFQSFFQFT